MSSMDDKQQDAEKGGAARRTYASLMNARGFREYVALDKGQVTVSICPMDVRSYWRHVGTGKPTAKDALYELVTP